MFIHRWRTHILVRNKRMSSYQWENKYLNVSTVNEINVNIRKTCNVKYYILQDISNTKQRKEVRWRDRYILWTIHTRMRGCYLGIVLMLNIITAYKGIFIQSTAAVTNAIKKVCVLKWRSFLAMFGELWGRGYCADEEVWQCSRNNCVFRSRSISALWLPLPASAQSTKEISWPAYTEYFLADR